MHVRRASLAIPLAVVGILAAVGLGWVGATGVPATVVPPWEFATIASAYFVAGAIAWRRRPENRIGRLMMGVGGGILVAMARSIAMPEVAVLSRALLGINEVILAYVLLAFPSGRLGRRTPRVLFGCIVAAFSVLVVLQLVSVDTTADAYCLSCPPNPFRLIQSPDVSIAVTRLALLTSGLLGAAVVVVLLWRWMRATPAARRALGPVLFAGVLESIGVASRALTIGDPSSAVVISRVAFLFSLAVPVALLVGFVRARLDRTAVAELTLAIGRAASPEEIERSLRATLHDDGLRVLVWSDAAGTYLDGDGRSRALPADDEPADQVATLVGDGTRRVAAIIHDPALRAEPDVLAAAATALRLAVERERLESSVRAQTADAQRLPRGQVTLLFADIEGSTALATRLGDRWPETLLEVRHFMASLVRRAGGLEVDARADEYLGVFAQPSDAVQAALAIQRGLAVRQWADGEAVRLRIGLHTGEPELTDEGYVGLEIHRAARVGTVGHGGQIVLSSAAVVAIGDDLPIDAEVVALGTFRLRGVDLPQALFGLLVADLPRGFPPLRADPV
ncbi:MAG: adenylate/guanylate cyclase domain-containing protein [Candidatus Limnocylindrales bacterium]